MTHDIQDSAGDDAAQGAVSAATAPDLGFLPTGTAVPLDPMTVRAPADYLPPDVGSTIEHDELLRKLGEGGMGTVYLFAGLSAFRTGGSAPQPAAGGGGRRERRGEIVVRARGGDPGTEALGGTLGGVHPSPRPAAARCTRRRARADRAGDARECSGERAGGELHRGTARRASYAAWTRGPGDPAAFRQREEWRTLHPLQELYVISNTW